MQHDILIQEPFSDYLEASKIYTGSHALETYRNDPSKYHRIQTGQEARGESPEFEVGRAAHTLILEGESAYLSQYEIGGPVNPKTKAEYGRDTKKFVEHARSAQKPVLRHADDDLIRDMAHSVASHKVASNLLKTGVAEQSCRTEINGVLVQGRFDWITDGEPRSLVDLKTTCDLDRFERQMRGLGYIRQMALYSRILRAAGIRAHKVFFIAVEKKRPYRCGVWEVGDEAICAAYREALRSLKDLALSQLSGEWPNGYEEARFIGDPQPSEVDAIDEEF